MTVVTRGALRSCTTIVVGIAGVFAFSPLICFSSEERIVIALPWTAIR